MAYVWPEGDGMACEDPAVVEKKVELDSGRAGGDAVLIGPK